MTDFWQLHSDGASRGNPGHAGAGAVIHAPDGREAARVSVYLGSRVTNNEAEYRGLLYGLEKALALGATKISIKMDSELIVKQLSGQYRVKHPVLKPLYEEVTARLRNFDQYQVHHVRRELNREADALATLAADQGRQ